MPIFALGLGGEQRKAKSLHERLVGLVSRRIVSLGFERLGFVHLLDGVSGDLAVIPLHGPALIRAVHDGALAPLQGRQPSEQGERKNECGL